MKPPFAFRTLVCLSATALIAACGGGEPATNASAQATDQARAARLFSARAGSSDASAAVAAATNAGFFKAAQAAIPSLFPGTPTPVPLSLSADGVVFDIRAYITTGYYLAVGSNNHVYGLGPMTANKVVDLGEVNALCAALGWDCSGGTGGGTGTLNGCVLPASQALVAGQRFTAVYVDTIYKPTSSTGEYTITGEVLGGGTFGGQQATKVASTIKGVQGGEPVDVSSTNYLQAAANDLTRTLGGDATMAYLGFLSTVHTVYDPADLNDEFTLALGTSMTKTTYMTTSTSMSGLTASGQPVQFTNTHTYEAQAPVTVMAGSFQSCRYRTVTQGTPGYQLTWHIIGKGFVAKTETYDGSGTLIEKSELKSATVNGAPL